MELSELTAYAREKYQIREEHKWADFPGFSVLRHPQTGKWIALLMRQWDTETGTEIQRCDLKCGDSILSYDPCPCVSAPIRMHGSNWIDVAFDDRTERDLVFHLFDAAIQINAPQGYTIVLDTSMPADNALYQDTALPFAESPHRQKASKQRQEIHRSNEHGGESEEALINANGADGQTGFSPDHGETARENLAHSRISRQKIAGEILPNYAWRVDQRFPTARSFYKQAVRMQDYEDDVPWSGEFFRYFPSYRDLTPLQLRGYFTWRAGVRKGVFQPIATSAAYIYLYELLNGVGADSPEDVLQKLRAFEVGYVDSGIGDKGMRSNLHRWMLEYGVLHDLPPELVREYADPDMMARDAALAALRKPEDASDDEVFSALCLLGGNKIAESPVVKLDPSRGRHLFSQVWRSVAAFRGQKTKGFSLFFGDRKTRRWHPLANAVYYEPKPPADRDYVLNACRSFRCRKGLWTVRAFESLSISKDRLKDFLHTTDARLRRYLKTGRYLKEKPVDAWALPCIDAVIEADKQARMEAAKPAITIDLSGLAQIRRDASATRESLLTEEEIEAPEEAPLPIEEVETGDVPLDPIQRQILQALLDGQDAMHIMKAKHLMPSMTADAINEALFDAIGDTVLLCEDDRLLLVDDYMDELAKLLGGTGHG